mmetsp:Transcript_88359/g.234969  ORF Transcript_88359/g.234969 Transcript_88359/m.234969 type:complete len:111 (-) Transcript_88359:216-548(-)
MFADVRQLQSLLCGISEGSNYDSATFTGNVFCDWNRGDLTYSRTTSDNLVWSDTSHQWVWKGSTAGLLYGDYGKGSEWPSYGGGYDVHYDPFNDGHSFGVTNIHHNTSMG